MAMRPQNRFQNKNRPNHGKKTGNNRSISQKPSRNQERASNSVDGRALVMGRHVIEELIKHQPERILQVFVERGGDGGRKQEILAQLSQIDVEVREVSGDELQRMTGSTSHQSFVAALKPREPITLKGMLESLEEGPALVLMVDGVQDPQNQGAILRAAECFGVNAVVWSRNRGVSMTPVVTKASVGASELVDWIEVGNLHDAILKCKEAGFWVVGTLAEEGAQSISELSMPERTLLIVGSEDLGMQPLLRKDLDFPVFIPMHGRIDSLNVSQATAVALYEIRRKLG